MAEPTTLTVHQVAAELQLTETTIRRWLRDGTLQGVRPGGTKAGWRIQREALDRLLKGKQ